MMLSSSILRSARGGAAATVVRSQLNVSPMMTTIVPRNSVVFQFRSNSSGSSNAPHATGNTVSTTKMTTNGGTITKTRSLSSQSAASSSSSSFSSSAAVGSSTSSSFQPVYVHHVSRVALEHFQAPPQAEWLVQRGLDRNLTIHPNGTFTLSFPSPTLGKDVGAESTGAETKGATSNKRTDTGRIWTSYDAQRKQHWLSVYRHKLAVRFLLKDHRDGGNPRSVGGAGCHSTATATTSRMRGNEQAITTVNYRNSIQQIQRAVDEMIEAVNRVEDTTVVTTASNDRDQPVRF